MKNEIWKDIPGYEGLYQVSDQGRVKSFKSNKETILKQLKQKSGYLRVTLCDKYSNKKYIRTHQLIAMAFLNHKPDNYNLVIDHIDRDKGNNILSNLRIVTQRVNTVNHGRKTTSKYTGVCFDKSRNKWMASIHVNKKTVNLGRFDKEIEAHLAYKKYLKSIENEQ